MTQTVSQAILVRPSPPPVLSTPAAAKTGAGAPLQDALLDLAKELGFQGAVYVHLGHAVRAVGQIVPLRFVASSVFDRKVFLESGALEIDPALAHAVGANAPYAWTTAQAAHQTEAQRQLNLRLRGRGIQAGVVAPVQDYAAGPAYLNFYSCFTGEAERRLRENAATVVFAASAFHQRAKALTPPLYQFARALLTSREIDCLRLAALGLTAQDTAEALEVTVRTVEFHLKNAAEKFGAPNKVRAVALAVSQGLIQP